MEEKDKPLKAVQEEWMGMTAEKDKQEDAVVVREFSCDFD